MEAAMSYRRIRIGQISSDPVVCFAAEELARYLKKIDPSCMIDRILSDSYQPEMKDVLWLGLSDSFDIVPDPWDDTFLVSVENGAGYITGSNPRSVLIGVYHFLRLLGCRFLHPGKGGERIPKKELISSEISGHENLSAAYRHRGLCIEGADSYENILDTIDYLPKVGMNTYFVQFMVPTEFFDRWYNHRMNPLLKPEGMDRSTAEGFTRALEAEVKKRGLLYHKVGHGWTCEPFGIEGSGWFSQEKPLTEEQISVLAEVNGVREPWGGIPLNTNLCYSQEKVRTKITDAITDYCTANPQVDVVHFWLADGSNNHCECENCRQKRPADWYVQMLNELDRKMSAKKLSTKVVFLIYVDLLWEPLETKIENPDRFILMFAPITRNYGQNYGDFLTYDKPLPPYVRNKLELPKSLAQNLAHLRRWQQAFPGDSFDFDYHLMWAHVGDPGYEACARNLFQDMKDLKKIGLNGMISCQVQRCYLPTALPVLAMAEALFNDQADYKSVANAYYQAAFGKNGKVVQKTLEKLSSLFHLYEGPGMGNKEHPVICDDFEEASSLIKEILPILKEASGEASQESTDSLYLKIYLEFFLECIGILKNPGSQTADETKSALEQLGKKLWESEPIIQPVLDVQNTVRTMGGLIQYLK